jgi:hypothetical protein
MAVVNFLTGNRIDASDPSLELLRRLPLQAQPAAIVVSITPTDVAFYRPRDTQIEWNLLSFPEGQGPTPALLAELQFLESIGMAISQNEPSRWYVDIVIKHLFYNLNNGFFLESSPPTKNSIKTLTSIFSGVVLPAYEAMTGQVASVLPDSTFEGGLAREQQIAVRKALRDLSARLSIA